MCSSDLRPPMKYGGNKNFCVVMVCADAGEAEQVGKQLSKLNTGCLVTYRRTEDLFQNRPAGHVALIILALNQTPAPFGLDVKLAQPSQR